MSTKSSPKVRLVSKWNSAYLRATDLDRWNDISEAILQYERCVSTLENDSVRFEEVFTQDQLKYIRQLCACFNLRVKTLRNLNQFDPITLTDLGKLRPLMKNFFSWKAPFPVSIKNGVYQDDISSTGSSQRSLNDSVEGDILAVPARMGKQLLPQLPRKPGCHRMTIRIANIGVKNPAKMILPFLTVSVKDDVGLSITADQDLREPDSIDGQWINFETDVHIQRYVENIYRGCSILFELKHYKEKRRLLATKCYTVLNVKELRSGPLSLRLFKLPIDYSRKSMIPMTKKKPLYLNIFVTIED